MLSKLVLLLISCLTILSISGCDKKRPPKDHLSKVTLKLEKPIQIKLLKQGKSNSIFNLKAEVSSKEVVNSAQITWVITDDNNHVVKSWMEKLSAPGTVMTFDSGTIEIPNPDKNHKIVFIFDGQTASDKLYKTEIYNSLLQEDLDRAIKDLEERGRY